MPPSPSNRDRGKIALLLAAIAIVLSATVWTIASSSDAAVEVPSGPDAPGIPVIDVDPAAKD